MQNSMPKNISEPSAKTTPQALHHITDTLVSQSLTAADYNPTHDAMLQRTLERIRLKKEQEVGVPLMSYG